MVARAVYRPRVPVSATSSRTRAHRPHRPVLAGALAVLCLVSACLVAGVVGTAVAATDSPSARGGSTYRTNYGGTRTIRAHRGTGRTLFRTSFWAVKGERRYVSTLVRAHHPRSSRDRVLMASVNVRCYPTAGSSSRVGATQNTRRGTTTELRARTVYVARSTGMVRCFARAGGGRPRPHGGSGNVWTVRPGSYLGVGAPMNASMRKIDVSSLTSRVLGRPGATWTPVARTVRLAAGTTRFRVVSDARLTVCSAVGGSKDPTTRGRNLCRGHVTRGGSSAVAHTVKVRQRRSDGSWCGGWRLLERQREARVSARVHHRMVYSRHAVAVNPACAPVFDVVVRLRLVRGADTVVHAGSLTTLITR